MTTGELLDDITDCIDVEESGDEPEHDAGCTCVEKIEQYRAEQWRAALLAAAKWMPTQARSSRAHTGMLDAIANDPERLKKLMEDSDGN